MLIVRRRVGQAIVIGDQVEVHVLEIQPGRVKLGVVAPKEIPVIRAEVKLTRQQNLEAAGGATPEKAAELAERLRSRAAGAESGSGPQQESPEGPRNDEVSRSA